jgi:hypothetical protein
MDANGEMETLEQIDGGFVLVWWNSDTGTLNIARDNQRPLHMAFTAKENTFYWASELTELLHLLKDVEIDEDIGILYPKPWTWYKFNLKNLREFEKVPFVKSQGRRIHNTHPTGQNHGDESCVTRWTEEELAGWEKVFEGDTKSMTSRSNPVSDSSVDEIEEIRQTVANQILKDAKLSGIPTSKKRIARAKMELRRLGIDYNSLRHCKPMSWCKYKNQENLGSVLAKAQREGFLIEVLQVRYEQFLVFQKAGNLLVDCVNVRNGPHNDTRVIGTVSPRMGAYLEHLKTKEDSKETSEADAIRRANAERKAREIEDEHNLNSIERNCDGPDGHKITMARFLELTSNGCAHCQCDIMPKHVGTIVWVGRPATPICEECSSDPGIMELVGFPDQHKFH